MYRLETEPPQLRQILDIWSTSSGGSSGIAGWTLPLPLILGKKKSYEGRKAGRESEKKTAPSLAQGLDPPFICIDH